MFLRVGFLFVVSVINFGKCRHVQEMYDLTWGYDNNSIAWPNTKEFEIAKRNRLVIEGQWIASNEICTNEHTGTHIDAPFHFYEKGSKVGDMPIEKMIGPGILLDMTYETSYRGANTTVEPYHLEGWIQNYGYMPDDCYLLIKFGWSKFYKQPDVYMGTDGNGKLNFPGISKAAADWIVRSGKIIGVGVDTASVDPGSATSLTTHATFAENNIYGLENINIVDEVPIRGFTLYVMPMKIVEGTGAPVRLIAMKDYYFYAFNPLNNL